MVACFVSAATSTDCQLEGDAQHHLWAEAFVASAVPRTVDARVNCIELVGGDGEAAAERRPGHVDEHRSPERSGAGVTPGWAPGLPPALAWRAFTRAARATATRAIAAAVRAIAASAKT